MFSPELTRALQRVASRNCFRDSDRVVDNPISSKELTLWSRAFQTLVQYVLCLSSSKNVFHIKESDSTCFKYAGCLRALIQRKPENTQQRARRISTKASVWASSASQSNIWKHFLSCNNKNTQHPRFQAQHSCIKPHCPLWSGLRKEAYTEIQLGLNASAQRLHSMTTQLTE